LRTTATEFSFLVFMKMGFSHQCVIVVLEEVVCEDASGMRMLQESWAYVMLVMDLRDL
jgi:hypothetical protein